MKATEKIKSPITKGVAKVPVVMQMEALECGAASLAMILAYYGKWIPLATSVEVVVAIACAMSPIIGGRAFTGNGRRFVPSGRSGVGGSHRFSLFND